MINRAIKPFILGVFVILLSVSLFGFLPSVAAVPHLDKIFHTVGGFIVAWFFVTLWSDAFKNLNLFQRIVACMAFAALIGFFWEVAEYSTSVVPLSHYPVISHYFYGGDVTDTLGDLMADVLGGALFALF